LWAWAAAIPDLPLGAQKYIEESNAMTPHKSDLSRVLNILLIDDLPVRRSGVARLIEGWAQEDGIAIRTSDLALPTNDPDYDFDLALLSIGGTDASSPKVQALIARYCGCAHGRPVAVLSDRDETSDVVAAIRAGAKGFISTRIEPHVMFRALKFIACGGVFFPPEALLDRDAAELEDEDDGGTDASTCHAAAGGMLTSRQTDVLHLLRLGQSNKYIARELHMRESTVKVHVRQIMRKLGAANRTQAALFARQMEVPASNLHQTISA
jgi:DNA-binding NarL/FixJ family response regulator